MWNYFICFIRNFDKHSLLKSIEGPKLLFSIDGDQKLNLKNLL